MLLDFFIVVVGVLIAFQITNWNQSRVELQQSQDYVIALVTELQQEQMLTQSLSNYYQDIVKNVVEADRFLASSEFDPQALMVAAYRASEYNVIPSNRVTWDQILSSGHLGLLPLAVIERGLLQYYRFHDESKLSFSKVLYLPYRTSLRSLIPLPVQLSIRQGCSDVMNGIGFVSEYELNINASLLEETAEALRSSSAIRKNLRAQ